MCLCPVDDLYSIPMYLFNRINTIPLSYSWSNWHGGVLALRCFVRKAVPSPFLSHPEPSPMIVRLPFISHYANRALGLLNAILKAFGGLQYDAFILTDKRNATDKSEIVLFKQ